MADRDSDPPILVTSTVTDDPREVFVPALREHLPGVDVVVSESRDEDRERLRTAPVAVTGVVDDEDAAVAQTLDWVQARSAGVDHYPLAALAEAGVTVTTASGVHAEPIGEQVLGYMLAFERNIHRGVRQQVAGEWVRYEGAELRGKTVGIVGLGATGGRAAELASALGTTVLGTKRDPSTAPDAADEVHGPDGLDELLPRVDYLVLTCPLTEATRGLIDADALAALPDSAVLVNVARGAVVDEAALVAALENGDVGGAALDVFETEPLPEDSPLWDFENVVVTPHMAGSTPRYYERFADLVAENYRRYRAGDPLRNAV